MIFGLWALIFFGALIAELATATSMVSIWFCVGSLFAMLAAYLNFDFTWQVVIFFVTSLLFLAVIRPMATEYLRGNTVATNADRVIGKQLSLQKGITPESWGELKYNGVIWNAASIHHDTIDKGSLVEVVAIEGSKLLVKRIK